ncbi:MAG: SDR family oxidoreductase [Bacteroidetes bacterium]|nr:SDR family oxidoreductase [Bacteroidota bacterium]
MSQKTILITGASSGIGRALAIYYSKQESQLILSARRKEQLESLKTICEQNGSEATIIVADLVKEEDILNLAKKAIEAYGQLHILINNAGVSQRGSVSETIFEVDRKIMEINYFGQIHLTKLLLPELKKKSGNIVVLSSLSGLFGFPLRSAYAASKHALHGFFETLQLEEKDIATTIVCPGRIKTDISLSALTSNGTKHGQMDEGQLKGIDVDVCAKKIATATYKKKKLLVIAKEENILLFFYRYCKPLFYAIASKIKAT